ncbi:MAG: Uracil-DNA glycosylase [Planctomycetota bacterium]
MSGGQNVRELPEWWQQLIPVDWQRALSGEAVRDVICGLDTFLEQEWLEHQVFPPRSLIFRALQLTQLETVRVVIVGQDPYHDEQQANGLAFAVDPPRPQPPSLRNIQRELQADLGLLQSPQLRLEQWARQGVLLLNTVLTVRAHEPNSHRGRGWETITDALLEAVNQGPPTAFVLWGAPAGRLAQRLQARHFVLKSPHPSPLSAYRGFFGSRPFSRVNAFLTSRGERPIDWLCEESR